MHRILADLDDLMMTTAHALSAPFYGAGVLRRVRLPIILALALSCSLADEPPDAADPALLPTPPADAVGYPSRDPHLDVLPGFRTPPPGYGVVPFYWWMGDPLTKERLAWQLDQLSASGGVSGLQVNYAHSDQGGNYWGLTFPSEPPLFSEEWWDLFIWWAGECKKRGIAVSLSDYTLGMVGQGYWTDEILAADPSLHGRRLECTVRTVRGAVETSWEMPENTLSVMAYRLRDDAIESGSDIDLRPLLSRRTLRWQAPTGDWQIITVCSRVEPKSIDPLNPKTGQETVARFFQRFEDRLPGESGRTLNFFFSDELDFGIGGKLWTDTFAAEFQKRKGYDLLPVLPGLFADIGPQAPRIRLDYADVLVILTEEAFFKPLFRWHYDRGMLFGCDHGGRGKDVVEFGDYFRTQRWMTGPGNDAPFLTADVVKNKVASSIAHLYERPRVWLEGFHSSGWGTSTADLTKATFRNYVHGHNLLSLHGLYYSTHGGWWEWAPPCNGFRMPYWPHIREYLLFVQRLSYLLSQGAHRCDVAMLYPVTPMQADMYGKEAVETAFALAQRMVDAGLDFDFIDDGSLARAEIRDGALHVAGEQYRVLILPHMTAVRAKTLEQAQRFKRAGGLVLAVGGVPQASDRHNRGASELTALVQELFPTTVQIETAVETITEAIERDFVPARPCQVLHRQVGPRDVFLVVGGGGVECVFHAQGRVELWDPWTGEPRPWRPTKVDSKSTTLTLPADGADGHIVVFSPGDPGPLAEPAKATTPHEIVLDGDWEFELRPTLDNRWGDFRLPASPTLIGPEAYHLAYMTETAPNPGWEDPATDITGWTQTTCGFGTHFWLLGPVPKEADANAIEDAATRSRFDPRTSIQVGGCVYRWRPYDFSWRFGVEGDPGHQGYHGLKESVSDDFIALGVRHQEDTTTTYKDEPGGGHYYLWTTLRTPRNVRARILVGGPIPSRTWLNGAPLDPTAGEVDVPAGATPLLLRYDSAGRGHFVLRDAAATDTPAAHPLSMTWYQLPGILPFDAQPEEQPSIGWYRFTAPPGLRGISAAMRGNVRAWADGREMQVARGERRDDDTCVHTIAAETPFAEPVDVVLRIEQIRGYYAGAAVPEPIALDCGPGRITLGDWSEVGVLATYSGGAWYRKTFTLNADAAQPPVILDLGAVVATAEVRVNGQPAGMRVAPPWRLDISHLVHPGENRVEILVYNTLANYYGTIPTRYRGSTKSGLLGPVRVLSGE
ncbi:MAG: hypothetical protein KKB50_11650 [Planctomycetes bacterium]|nr:hypothetical protein [Planctomycetota bacterium]